jgi:hypothetical protein
VAHDAVGSITGTLCIRKVHLSLFYQATDIIDVPIIMPLMRSYHNRTEETPQTLLMATTQHMKHLRSALFSTLAFFNASLVKQSFSTGMSCS